MGGGFEGGWDGTLYRGGGMVPSRTGVVVQGVGVVADGGFTERIRALWEEFMGELVKERSREGKEKKFSHHHHHHCHH